MLSTNSGTAPESVVCVGPAARSDASGEALHCIGERFEEDDFGGGGALILAP